MSISNLHDPHVTVFHLILGAAAALFFMRFGFYAFWILVLK